MISEEQYERLTVKSRRPKSLVQFFRDSPLVGVELDLERIGTPDAILSCECRLIHERIPARYKLCF